MINAAIAAVTVVNAMEIDVNTSSFLGDDAAATNSTTSTGAVDGIWTGHDWQLNDIGVRNGLPYGVNEPLNQRISST